MFGLRKKEKLIILQSERIKELEELICPCESHSWSKTGYHFNGGTGIGDELTINHYICRKCRKRVETWHILPEKEA